MGSDGAADAQAESESGCELGSVLAGDGSSSVDAGDGSAAGSSSSVRAGDATGDATGGSAARVARATAASASASLGQPSTVMRAVQLRPSELRKTWSLACMLC